MAAKKYVIKHVRVDQDMLDKIERVMEREGIPTFGAFAKMAYQNLVKRFEEDERMRNAAGMTEAMDRFEEMVREVTKHYGPRDNDKP